MSDVHSTVMSVTAWLGAEHYKNIFTKSTFKKNLQQYQLRTIVDVFNRLSADYNRIDYSDMKNCLK